jgi:hypothetical protein
VVAAVSHPYDGYPLSYGGGVNSTALVVLLAGEGWHGDILYAETGAEWPETDAYVAMFEQWLRGRGLSLTRLGPEWRRGKAQMALVDYCEHYRVTPHHLHRWCTSKWKVEPLERWKDQHGFDLADSLVGIAADEARRMPERVRPLVDRGIDRDGCARIISDASLPVPRKSGCYICPFMSQAQWRELLEHHPALYERAARLEELASERRGRPIVLEAHGLVSLRQFAAQTQAQPGLFRVSEYYQPCMCRL